MLRRRPAPVSLSPVLVAHLRTLPLPTRDVRDIERLIAFRLTVADAARPAAQTHGGRQAPSREH